MGAIEINYLAVLAGAMVNMVLGFLWYGPFFGKEWIKLLGIKQKKGKDAMDGMPMILLTSFILAVIMSYVISHIVDFMDATDWMTGAQAGFWVWLGFVFTVILNQALYLNKPKKLVVIDSGYYLVALILMGIISAVWV